MTEQQFDWLDIGFTGMVRLDGSLAHWRVLEAYEYSESSDPTVKVGWWPKGASSLFPCATDPTDAQSVVEVTVKADGCANWSWDDACATHTCDGVNGARKLAAMINRVMSTTADVLHPNWIRS